MTLAARNIRSNVRHHFLQSPELKLIYDVMTWIATQVAISYTVAPFVLLSVKPSLQFYGSWYYCLHFLCILVLLIMPARARKKERTEKGSIAPPMGKVNKEENKSEHNSHATTNNNSSQREETAWRRPSAPQWPTDKILYVFTIPFIEPPIGLWIVHRTRWYYKTFDVRITLQGKLVDPTMPCHVGLALQYFHYFIMGTQDL